MLFVAGHPFGPLGRRALATLLGVFAGAWLAVPTMAQSDGEVPPAYRAALDDLLRSPGDLAVSFGYAEAAVAAGDVTGVTAALERLLATAPDLSNIRLELGLLYLRQGDPVLAEHFIAESLADPSIPDDIRRQAAAYLAEAQALQERWTTSAALSAGLTHHTNANSGPTGTVQFVTDIGEVEGRLRKEDTGTADIAATLALSGEARYDTGTQAGHQLVFGGVLYGEAYRERSELNIGYVNGTAGIEFNLGPTLGKPSTLAFTTIAAALSRDGEHYLTETGAALDFRLRANERLEYRAGASIKYQDYSKTDAAPLNDNRDGAFTGFYGGVSFDPTPRVRINGTLLARRKDARESYEAYRELGGSLELLRLFDAPSGAWGDIWEGSLLAAYSVVDYDDLDLTIDLDTAQRDERLRLEAGLRIPTGSLTDIELRLGYFDNHSNFAIRDYDDVYSSVFITRRF